MCVEEIKNQLKAELHLFQLRTIVKALGCCKYFAGFATPPTVGAAWADTDVDGKPFLIAFATTCVGPKKNLDETKEEMSNVRCDFIKTLTTHRQQNLTIRVNCTNRRGNCPEFVTWRLVCQEVGNYFSLCFSTGDWEGKGKSMKFCGHCEELARFLRGQSIDITDLWDKALLCDQQSNVIGWGRYPFRPLQSMEQILNLLNNVQARSENN
jgi:hypothetical protein